MFRFLSRLALSVLFLLLLLPAHTARPPAFQWERMRVPTVLPSQVFARLGLTHITRRGYTRDGGKKTDPDPTFPPGLTDVVPLDAEHVLLVRGTVQGRAAFRTQVAGAQAQIVAARWHVEVQLLRVRESGLEPQGTPWIKDVPDDVLQAVSLDDGEARLYRVRVHADASGGLTVQWQNGVTLSGTAMRTVLAPPVAWSPIQTQTMIPGNAVTFEDMAADRHAARLDATVEAAEDDYQLRVTVTSLVPPVAVPPPTAPPIPSATVPLSPTPGREEPAASPVHG